MDTFSPSCQLLYKMTLLSDQRFEQSVCLLWFRPCHFVSEPPFVFHQDSGLVWDPSSAPGNNIWWWWRSLRDSILMCDPSCALGNDRAAGISFIHEQLSTMIHLLHLLLPIHQDVFSCSGAYTFCTAFYFQFWCHTCGPCLVISELDSGDTNVCASNLRWKRGYQFHWKIHTNVLTPSFSTFSFQNYCQK